MLHIFWFAVALLLIPAVVPAMAAKVDASCNQVFEAAAVGAHVKILLSILSLLLFVAPSRKSGRKNAKAGVLRLLVILHEWSLLS